MTHRDAIAAVLVLAGMFFAPAVARADVPAETPAQHDARMAWWRDARFGLFIHWGLYAIPGRGEWVQWNEQIPVDEYAKLAQKFAAEHYDPNAWADVAKSAGMKYVVLTTRHHDGFCLFDDPGNDFTAVATAAHRDLVADYATAMRKAGLRVGFYYSPLDWRYPGFFFPDLQRKSAEAMRDQYHRQMTELMSNYGKLDVIWFDGGEADWLGFNGDWKSGAKWERRPPGAHYTGSFSWQHDQVYQQLRKLQPQAIINGRADMPEDFHSREGDGALGDFDDRHPWELCTTLAGAWGWQPNHPVKPLKDCVQLLAKTAGRDGNLLLNIGMPPDGQIDPGQAKRLHEIGDWLSKYGQSIYATRGGPFLPGAYGVSTRHGNAIYLHLLSFPGDQVTLPAIKPKVTAATLLGGPAVDFHQTDTGIVLTIPKPGRDDLDPIVELKLDADAATIAPVAVHPV
jgi:alpha-L-fucosidase